MFKKLRPFSLIELLIVIVVIGILAAMMMPKIGDFSDKAKKTTDTYNGLGIFRALESFHAANGKYPACLHTGVNEDGTKLVQRSSGNDASFNPIETGNAMTGALLRNMSNATTELGKDTTEEKEIRESLKRAGISLVSHGVNKWSVPTSEAPFRQISGQWYNTDGDSIRVRGQTIADHILGSEDYYRVIPLFVTHHTIWDKSFIRNATNNYSPENILASNVTVGSYPTVAPGAKDGDFGYYLVLFFAYTKKTALVDGDVRPAEILSVFTSDGKPVTDNY